VVALDQRLENKDLAADLEKLEAARAVAKMKPEEQAQWWEQNVKAEEQRKQIAFLAKQAQDATMAVVVGGASRPAYVKKMNEWMVKAVDGEPPDSPWHELAAYFRALVALVERKPVPPVPAAYQVRFEAVRVSLPPWLIVEDTRLVKYKRLLNKVLFILYLVMVAIGFGYPLIMGIYQWVLRLAGAR
jgi:hypothetical protein